MVGRALLVVTVLLASCDAFDIRGLVAPTGDVVDSRFEQSMLFNGGEAAAVVEAGETYTFYVCADPHIDDTYENLCEFATQMRNDPNANFGIVLGDCVDRNSSALPNYVEAIGYIADFQATNMPIFSLIGNHDLFFDGWRDYSKLLGASVYWFDVDFAAGCDLFIALDSASGTLGERQMKWLREFLANERGKYRHCVVLTHTNLFYADNSQQGSGNMALEEMAVLVELFSRHNVTLCLQGHDHYREDLMLGGVRYTTVGTIQDGASKPEYLTVRMSNSGVEYQWGYVQ